MEAGNALSNAQIESLKHLSQIQRLQFDIRQRLEWRAIFTALSFYVLLPVAVKQYSIAIPKGFLGLLVLYLIFTIIIAFFLARIQHAHTVNKNAAEKAENKLWELCGFDLDTVFPKCGLTNFLSLPYRGFWFWLMQMSVIVIAMLFSLFVAASAMPPPPTSVTKSVHTILLALSISEWTTLLGGTLLLGGLLMALLSNRYISKVMGPARLGVAVLSPALESEEWKKKNRLLKWEDFWFFLGIVMTGLGIVLQTAGSIFL